jgi:7-carboxy-7-deazaguanine synthase (Cx14CxxC type)
MTYAVKESFVTLQGEGAQAGRRAVFVRFAGCNLWSGLERDRATAACRFCDTEFVGTDGDGGGKFDDPISLAAHADALWGETLGPKLVVATGGEPTLQLDKPLIDALHERGFEIAIESNGTLPAPAELDWICVSPKAGTSVVQRSGDELKLVWPQEGIDLDDLETWDFRHFFIQPMDCADARSTLGESVQLVMNRPRWRLGLQAHKLIGLP